MVQYTAQQGISPQMEGFISASLGCHSICLETVRHCLQMDGRQGDAPFRLLLDCAEICQTGASLLPRGSGLDGRLCLVCAEVCDDCAIACERFVGDAQMQACAEVCRATASTARRMAQTILAG